MMISDKVFSHIVSEDIKNRATPEQSSLLRSVDALPRWRKELDRIHGNVSQQLADINLSAKADQEKYSHPGMEELLVQAQYEWDEKARKIERFKFHVEQTIIECDQLLNNSSSEVERRANRTELLEAAIKAHRDYSTTNGYDAEPHDVALWASLQGEWTFDEL